MFPREISCSLLQLSWRIISSIESFSIFASSQMRNIKLKIRGKKGYMMHKRLYKMIQRRKKLLDHEIQINNTYHFLSLLPSKSFLRREIMVNSPKYDKSFVISLIYFTKMDLFSILLLVFTHQEYFYVIKVCSSAY